MAEWIFLVGHDGGMHVIAGEYHGKRYRKAAQLSFIVVLGEAGDVSRL